MLRPKGFRFVSLALAAALTACGIILDLPDETKLGSDLADGSLGDADVTGDGAIGADGTVDDGAVVDDGGTEADVVVTCDLTLPQNCGACGVDCTNGTCTNGLCLLTDKYGAQPLYEPYGIAVYGDKVFATLRGTPLLASCPTNGCLTAGVTSLVQFDASDFSPAALAVDDAGALYWTNFDYNNTTRGGVYKTLGASTTQINAGFASEKAETIAISPTHVFWGESAFSSGGFVCPISGCTAKTQVANVAPNVEGIAVTPKGTVWTDETAKLTLCETPGCDTGKVTVIADGQGYGLNDVVYDSTRKMLYWSSAYPEFNLNQAPLEQDGGVWSKLYPPPGGPGLPNLVRKLLVVGDALYWITHPDAPNDGGIVKTGRIQKCQLPACTTVVDVVQGIAAPAGLATDGKAIYFTANDRPDYLNSPGYLYKAPL